MSSMRWGLDVHARETTVVVLGVVSGVVETRRVAGRADRMLD